MIVGPRIFLFSKQTKLSLGSLSSVSARWTWWQHHPACGLYDQCYSSSQLYHPVRPSSTHPTDNYNNRNGLMYDGGMFMVNNGESQYVMRCVFCYLIALIIFLSIQPTELNHNYER